METGIKQSLDIWACAAYPCQRKHEGLKAVVKTREDALRLVGEFRQGLEVIYGHRLRGVYLFGSYARGEADEDSDVDVAVVLEGPVHGWTEGKRTIELVGDLSLRECCVIVPFFLSEQEHCTTPYAVHRSIVREGVAV